jgi:uroporphyrinogen decarboxylase
MIQEDNMTSRERIIATLSHIEPDRVAIDLGATNATGISAVVYNKLKDLLGIREGEIRVTDIIQQLAEVEAPVLDALGGDAVMLRKLAPSMGIPFKGFKPGVLSDGTPCLQAENYNPEWNDKGELVVYKITDGSDRLHPYPLDQPVSEFGKGMVVAKMPKGSHAFTRVYHPLENVDSIEELDRFEFPEIDQEELDFVTGEARRLYEDTDRAICGIFHGQIFEYGQLYWGYQTFFENMAAEPDMVTHFFERRMAALLRDLEKYLTAVGKYIQIINFFDDLGAQTGMLISPDMYREMIKPWHARLFAYVKRHYPDVKIFFHTCGAVYDVIPDLIEIGVDILNPVQITAAGMDPARLKREFGRQLAFWGGGVDTQTTLNRGTVEDVRRQVKEMLDIFSPGGGYVFSQVHNIEANVPAENVLAAFETAKNYRR